MSLILIIKTIILLKNLTNKILKNNNNKKKNLATNLFKSKKEILINQKILTKFKKLKKHQILSKF